MAKYIDGQHYIREGSPKTEKFWQSEIVPAPDFTLDKKDLKSGGDLHALYVDEIGVMIGRQWDEFAIMSYPKTDNMPDMPVAFDMAMIRHIIKTVKGKIVNFLGFIRSGIRSGIGVLEIDGVNWLIVGMSDCEPSILDFIELHAA